MSERELRAELEGLQARHREKTRLLELPETPGYSALLAERRVEAERLEAELLALRGPVAHAASEQQALLAVVTATLEQHRQREHGALNWLLLFLLPLAGCLGFSMLSAALSGWPDWAQGVFAVAVSAGTSLALSSLALQFFRVPSLRSVRRLRPLAWAAAVLTLGSLATGWLAVASVDLHRITATGAWAASLGLSLTGLLFTTMDRARTNLPRGRLLRSAGFVAPVGFALLTLLAQVSRPMASAKAVLVVAALVASIATVSLEDKLRKKLWPWLRVRFGVD
jgi:hypothetical protein